MNKLSKIAIISSLSVLGAVTTVNGVLFAQEDNTTPAQEIPVESRDRRAPMRDRENPSRQRQDNQRATPPMQNRGDEIKEKSPEQRAVNQDNKNSQPSILTSEQREQKIKERCEAVGMKILNHQNNFKSKSQARLTKYNQITTRLETVSTRLAEKGVDVITYNSYITELKAKITALNTANQEYVQLFGTKANTGEFCNNKEQLAAEVETRKSKLQEVIAKDKEIRMYIKDTMLPYLKSIKPAPTNTEASTSGAPSNPTVPVQ